MASGAWSGTQATSGSMAVTQPAAGTYSYSLSCTGAGGSANGSATLGVTSLTNNMAAVIIDAGPAGAAGVINLPFVSITLCRPGTTTCQTIDHVLLDTGSYGLRILAPGVLDPALALPAVTGAAGNAIGECAQFISGFLWGSVRRADVKIAGEVALSLPVQQVGDTGSAFRNIPSACSNTGANLGTVSALGANGILGVGLFNQDCGASCASQANAGIYYECSASACAGTTLALANQVANPVAAFSTDNNGVSVSMPAVTAAGATTLAGTLVFGIDTQPNNAIGAATVYATNSSGNFTTTYKGTAYTSSFLDTGSNGLFFSDSTIPSCSQSSGFSGFYCPAAALVVSAVNSSPNGSATGTVSITIVSPQSLDPTVRAAPIAGSSSRGTRSRSFDWGLPFFFGRTVFVAIDGASTRHGTGPYWAY